MKYNIQNQEVKDMTDIFKKSDVAFAVSHNNSWPKKLGVMSVQTGDL